MLLEFKGILLNSSTFIGIKGQRYLHFLFILILQFVNSYLIIEFLVFSSLERDFVTFNQQTYSLAY